MNLVGIGELAKLLGVSKQRAGQIVEKENFPKRLDDPPLRMGPVWKRDTVERWIDKNRNGKD